MEKRGVFDGQGIKEGSFMVSLLPGNLLAMKNPAAVMVPPILSSDIFLVTKYPEVIALSALLGKYCLWW